MVLGSGDNKMSMKTSDRHECEKGLPSRESQSCWDDGSEGRARALYSKTTELEMIWLLMATCSVTRPVSWAGQEEEKYQCSQSAGMCLSKKEVNDSLIMMALMNMPLKTIY